MKKAVYIFKESNSGAAEYGIGTYINGLTNSLLESSLNNSISINVICLFSTSVEFEITINNKIRYINIPNAYKNIDLYYKHIAFLIYPFIARDLEDKKIYLQFNYYNHFYLIKLIKSKFNKVTTIFTIHYFKWAFILKGNVMALNHTIECYNKKIRLNEIQKDVISLIENEKTILGYVDIIICLSKFAINLLKDLYKINPQKLLNIPNRIDTNENHKIKFYSNKEKSMIKKSLNFREEDKLILFVGRIHPLKGIEYLIDSFKKVLEIDENFRLIIIGDGEYDIILTRAKNIWSNIVLTGKIDYETLSKFYQIADVGVLPSLNEQCSYTIIEMNNFSLPCIGTSSTGLSEQLDNIKTSRKVRVKEHIDSLDFPILDLANYIIELSGNK